MSIINSSLEHVYCSNYCSNLVFNHNLIRLIRFVSQFTSKLYNLFFISSKFTTKILIRYDSFRILNFASKQRVDQNTQFIDREREVGRKIYFRQGANGDEK